MICGPFPVLGFVKYQDSYGSENCMYDPVAIRFRLAWNIGKDFCLLLLEFVQNARVWLFGTLHNWLRMCSLQFFVSLMWMTSCGVHVSAPHSTNWWQMRPKFGSQCAQESGELELTWTSGSSRLPNSPRPFLEFTSRTITGLLFNSHISDINLGVSCSQLLGQ